MKVILLKDVARVGQHGEVRDIADGYALNYLLPRGFARQATKEALAEHSKRERAESIAHSSSREKAQAALNIIDGQRIPITERANEKGSLFKSVREDGVASAIRHAVHIDVDPSMIHLGARPIKTIGEYVVHVATGGANATITLVVVAAGAAH